MDMDLIWQQYELGGLEEGIRTLFPDGNLPVRELLEMILQGDILGAGRLLILRSGSLGAEVLGMKNVLIWLLVVGILSSLMMHFVEVFDRNQVADLSFYLCYLVIVAVLLKTFYQAAEVAGGAIDNVLVFHRTLIPTFLLAVGVACGTTTVAAYSQLLLFIMYLVEQLLMNWVLPAIYGYCLLAVIGGIWKEEKLALLMELIRKAVDWILKGAIGLVTGIGAFQAVVAPVVDSVKSTALQKVLAMLPGAGNLADGVAELLAGSALTIKNSVGVLLLLLLLALCLTPLIKLLLIALLLKVAAALLGLVADGRITLCVNQVGEAGLLLVRVVGCVLLLFLIALAIVAAATRVI